MKAFSGSGLCWRLSACQVHRALICGLVEGARIPIRLAFEDLGGVSGKYWANPSVSNRGDGQVMER